MADIENLPYHRKYRPNTLSRYIGNQKLKETAMKALQSNKRPQVILLWGDSGCGKAQPLNSLVLTVNGYKRMGDIKIGDKIFTHQGNIGKISGIYPQGMRRTYCIVLSDGTFINVSDEHLNCIHTYNIEEKKEEYYTLTTLELEKLFHSSKRSLKIEAPSVDWDEKDIELDPYLVGTLIGGLSQNGDKLVFTCVDNNVLDRVSNILCDKYDVCLSTDNTSDYAYTINNIYTSECIFEDKDTKYYGYDALRAGLRLAGYPVFDNLTLRDLACNTESSVFDKYPELRGTITMKINQSFVFWNGIKSLGLCCDIGEQSIPEEYLYNSKAVRQELLQGICDMIGIESKDGSIEVKIWGTKLSKDFAFLVRSLGIIDKVVECCDKYTAFIHTLKMPYSCDRLSREIVDIYEIDAQECQCIMVDHPDHTYISDYFIPTHNTTFARLLAKEYSCEDRDVEKGACGQCASCQMIDDYIATGDTSVLTTVQEIDITDQSGKKDLDSVLADMEIPSYGDEWKIYIFDECHMATAGLQNRLLKIAEEPPEHVLMLLCTTNPEKLIETLKNRCQLQLHVTKPKVKELAGLLRMVCETEGVEYDTKGLEFIANRGELTIRTALTNLQQVVTEQNAAYYDNAIKVFESVSNTVITDFFKALKAKDTLRYVTILYDVKTKMDLYIFLNELKGFVQRGIYTINSIQLDGVSDGELKTYRVLFGDMGVAKISYLLNKLLNLNPNNLEMELLMLGYTGLDGDIKDDTEDVFTAEIHSIEGELSKEAEMTNTVLKEKREQDYARGVANSVNMMQNVDIEDLLNMGGTLVEQ